MPITISLVEDHSGIRESFAALLDAVPGFRCVGIYRTAEEALKEIPAVRPDVALVDIHLPGMNGIECVAKLKAKLPELQILMLTMYDQNDLVFNSLRAGASGYLLKNTPAPELIEAIKLACAGDAPMSMSLARKVMDHFRERRSTAALESLVPQEQQILKLMAKGLPHNEIRECLGIGRDAMRWHLHSIYQKLHVKSRSRPVAELTPRDGTRRK